jgi:hypothetical protein
MTKQKWAVAGIITPIIIALVSFGFSAMSTNSPFTVPIWLPILFFVLACLLIVGLFSYLMWSLLKRIHFRFPIFLVNQQKSSSTVTILKNNSIHTQPPRRLEHDGVLWEDIRDRWGNVKVIGPFCPKDYTPLSVKKNHKIEANLRFDTSISASYYAQLVCLECHTEYTLGKDVKKIQESFDEVVIRFEGMRMREREIQLG